jgi:hypothetical protein
MNAFTIITTLFPSLERLHIAVLSKGSSLGAI